MIHGVLFRHETSMSNGNNFRVALDDGLLKASGQMQDLSVVSGLNASFIVAIEKLQLISFHDGTDTKRIRIVIKEPEGCPRTWVRTVAVMQLEVLRLMSSRVVEVRLRNLSTVADPQLTSRSDGL